MGIEASAFTLFCTTLLCFIIGLFTSTYVVHLCQWHIVLRNSSPQFLLQSPSFYLLALQTKIKTALTRCHFKAKMHKNQFLLGLHPVRPRWGAGAYSVPRLPIDGFKGPSF